MCRACVYSRSIEQGWIEEEDTMLYDGNYWDGEPEMWDESTQTEHFSVQNLPPNRDCHHCMGHISRLSGSSRMNFGLKTV